MTGSYRLPCFDSLDSASGLCPLSMKQFEQAYQNICELRQAELDCPAWSQNVTLSLSK